MSRSISSQSAAAAAAADPAAASQSVSVTVAQPTTSRPKDEHEDDGEECAGDANCRFWFTVAGISGALAVGASAYGAHGLKKHVSDMYYVELWNTGAHYHFIHSLALGLAPIAVAAMRRHRMRTGQGVLQSVLSNLGLGGRAAAKSAVARSRRRVRLAPYRNYAATTLFIGTLGFSGSLYALALTEEKKYGLMASAGGTGLILGWLLLALGL